VTICAGFIAFAVTPHSMVAAGATSCESVSSLVLHARAENAYGGLINERPEPQGVCVARQYDERVLDTMGCVVKTQDWYRLFMVPGKGHCGGGEGPNSVDMLSALEQWVEKGQAPGQIVASHGTAGKVDRTRPLCPYPQMARYTGTGSIDDAANFVCRMPWANSTQQASRDALKSRQRVRVLGTVEATNGNGFR
jgi:hypothetical protein